MRLAVTHCFMGVVWRRRMLFHLAWELPNFVSSSFVFPLEPELCFRSINFGARPLHYIFVQSFYWSCCCQLHIVQEVCV